MKERLLEFLPTLMHQALGWLRRMVEINSFTANAAGVDLTGKLTAACFADLGFEAEHVPSVEPTHGAHLFLHRGDKNAKPVVLVTHLDTVFPPEEEIANDFHWREAPDEGRIYGPGTVDIKGGTILIWMLLYALRELQPALFEETHWIIAANASEEVMSGDFARQSTLRCPNGAKALLVFEGGPHDGNLWTLVTARKGRAEYRIVAHGKGAHAGSAHTEGINAAVALCQPVIGAAALTDYAKKLTVNVGRIDGGTVLNRVPHHAFADLEMRAFDPDVLAGAGESVMNLAVPQPAVGAAGIEVVCLGHTPAWPEKPEVRPLIEAWQSAGIDLGFEVNTMSRGGLSDANYLSHLGPTIDGLGPCGGGAHCSEHSADGSKTQEYADLDSFVPKTALNALAIVRFLKSLA